MTASEIIASYSDDTLFGIVNTASAIDRRDQSWLEKRRQLAREEIYRREKLTNKHND